MPNPEHLKILKKGIVHWNQWREKNPEIQPELIEADLGRANLLAADLSGANLQDVTLYKADLFKANLSGANLSGANLMEANLSGADLGGAILREADLRTANLIDSIFDEAILTGTKLWETQRSGWQIKGVICERIYWDEEGEEATEYAPGEFERAFSEKPTIVLNYSKGISKVEFGMLPLVLERLQEQHGDCVLNIRSIQDEGNGATITITVEDSANRDSEVFQKEIVEITNKLEGVKGFMENEKNQSRLLYEQNRLLEDKLFHLIRSEYEIPKKLAVLFLDMEHFARMSENEQLETVKILRNIADSLIKIYDGKYANTWGDAIVVAFDDPNSGLEFACKLIQHLKVDELKTRIGMSYGNFSIKNDPLQGGLNPQGAAMSEGARLESFADEGEVLISPALRHHSEVDETCFSFQEVKRKVEKAFADHEIGDELICYTVSLK